MLKTTMPVRREKKRLRPGAGRPPAPRNEDPEIAAYIEEKVRLATAHLAGLSEAQLEYVRELLRGQLATEPELRALVRKATGSKGKGARATRH